VSSVSSCYGFAIGLRHPQYVAYVNALDDKHSLIGLDLSSDLPNQVVRSQLNLARCQRAGKRAR
jgi:hypothetical protein